MSQPLSNKRTDWENNHRNIGNAILTHTKSAKRPPTQAELAKLTGLSRETVNKHLQELDYNKLFETQRALLATNADVLTMALLNSAIKGNVAAQKMFFQIVYGWTEPKSFQHSFGAGEDAPTPEELADMDKGIDMLVDLHLKRKVMADARKTAKVHKTSHIQGD